MNLPPTVLVTERRRIEDRTLPRPLMSDRMAGLWFAGLLTLSALFAVALFLFT